jgi:hypothetical protein
VRVRVAQLALAVLTVSVSACGERGGDVRVIEPVEGTCARPPDMDPLPTASPASLPSPSDLEVVWREVGPGYRVPNDAANGAIAFATSGELRLVDPDGAVRWSWMGDQLIDVDISQQVVVVEDVDGGVAVTSLDIRTGVESWTERLGLEPALASLVDVVDETVFIHALVREPSSGEEDLELCALDAGSGAPVWRMTGQMIGAGDSMVVVEQPRGPCRFVVLDAVTGEVRRPLEQIELGRVERLGTRSAGAGRAGHVFVR